MSEGRSSAERPERRVDETRTAATAAGVFTMHSAGALISRWDSATFGPVIFTSADAEYQVGASPHGGIPICFPWFGPPVHSDPAASSPHAEQTRYLGQAGATSAHGFARLVNWRTVATSEEADGTWNVAYRLASEDVPASVNSDLLSFVAELRATMGDREATIALAVVNTGDQEFWFEEALHAYFRVSDVSDVLVEGLEGLTRVDATGAGAASGAPSRQNGPIAFGEMVVQLYPTTDSPVIVDRGLGRRITIATTESGTTVVWNPGPAQGEAISDLRPGEWRRFICVESGNAMDAAIRLGPGRSHTMSVNYSIERLEG